MAQVPAGFRVLQKGTSAPAIPAGFRIVQTPPAPPTSAYDQAVAAASQMSQKLKGRAQSTDPALPIPTGHISGGTWTPDGGVSAGPLDLGPPQSSNIEFAAPVAPKNLPFDPSLPLPTGRVSNGKWLPDEGITPGPRDLGLVSPDGPGPRAPEDSFERDRLAITGAVPHAFGNLVGAPANLLDSSYGAFARILDLVMPGDQSGRYADPTGWRKNLPGFSALPTGEAVNGAIMDPLYEGIFGDKPLAPEEMTPEQRIANTATEFATSALVPSTILARPSTRAAAETLPNFLKPAGEAITRPYLPGPNQATPLGDAFASAGAGAMYQGWQDSDWRDSLAKVPGVGEPAAVLADVASGIIGGVAANALHGGIPALARQGVNLAKATSRGFMPEVDINFQNPDGSYVRKRDLDLAGRMVQGEGDPAYAEPFTTPRGGLASDPRKAAARLASTGAELREFAGPEALPTAGLTSSDIGLIGVEQGFRQNPKMRNAFIERDRNVRQAAVDTVDDLSPEGALGRDFTGAIDDAQTRRVTAAEQRALEADADLQANAREQLDLAAPVAGAVSNKSTSSQALAEPLLEDLRNVQQRKNAAFDAIDPDGTKMRSAEPLLAELDAIDARTVIPSNRPNEVADAIRTIAAQNNGQVSFRQLNELRTEIASLARAARSGANPNYRLADNFDALKRIINREASALAREGDLSAVEANRIYDQEFAPLYNRGGGDPATRLRLDLNRDRQHGSFVPGSGVADRFLDNARPERVASLRRLLESSPNAERGRRAVHDWMLADLANAGGVLRRDGTIDPTAVRRWISSWGEEALQLSPALRSELDDLITRAEAGQANHDTLANTLREAQANLDQVKRADDAIGKVLGADPVHAVGRLLNSPDPKKAMEEIARTIGGNEVARNGLKAAVIDYLTEKATTSAIEGTAKGDNPLSFAKLDDILNQYKEALAGPVFDANEMHALRVAHQMLAPLRNLGVTAVAGSTTSSQMRLYEDIKIPLRMALRLRFGLLKGGGVASVVDNAMGMLNLGRGGADGLIARMFFDPELAAHLLTRDVSRVGSPGWNAKLIGLLTLAASRENQKKRDETLVMASR